MTIYRVLISGRSKSNAQQVDNAIATIPGLTACSVDATGQYAFITVDTDLNPEALLAMIGDALAGTGCSVQLADLVSKPEEPKLHEFVFAFVLEVPDDALLNAWDIALRTEFGEAFELTWTREADDTFAVMTASIHSYLTDVNMLARISAVGENISVPVDCRLFERMKDATPKKTVPKPASSGRVFRP